MVNRNARIGVELEGDAGSLRRTLTAAGREIDDFQRAGGRASSLVGAGFSAAAIGITATGVAMGFAAREAIELAGEASDLIETQNKVNEVFKDSSSIINAWAEDSATAFGLSKREALDAAGTIGNMFIQLGIGTERAAELSQGMVELAADFASFHNADITDVLVAQQAAFRGEFDAVQRFVPTINAAAVEQQALAMGLAKTTAELSAQDKALATERLLLEGAGDAMGDFARTSEGAANQQRILEANIANMRAEIGTALLPVLADVTSAINDWIATNGDEFVDDLTDAIRGTIDAANDLFNVLNDLRNSGPVELLVNLNLAGFDLLGDALEAVAKLPGAAKDVLEGAAATVRGIAAGAQRAGGAAFAIPSAIGGLRRDVLDAASGRVPTGGFLAQADLLPEGFTPPPGIDAVPGDADLGIGLEGAGAAFLAARAARNRGTGERTPTRTTSGRSAGAGNQPTSFSAASLGLIDQILAGLPGEFAPEALDETAVNQFEDEARRFQEIRNDVNRQLAELGLTLADLDARGGENTEEFAALRDRMDALRDASQRIDLIEDLRLTPWKEAIDGVSESIQANLEAQKKMSESLLDLSTQFLNVKIAPGAQGAFSEFFGQAGGSAQFGAGGEFGFFAGGGGAPVDVVVP